MITKRKSMEESWAKQNRYAGPADDRIETGIGYSSRLGRNTGRDVENGWLIQNPPPKKGKDAKIGRHNITSFGDANGHTGLPQKS